MGNYTSLNSLFEATASAIRIKLGTSELIAASSFPEKIAAIPTGAAVSGTTTLTVDKSTYNVSQYSNAYVDVISNLNHFLIDETIAAASDRAKTYSRVVTNSEYLEQVDIMVPSVSLSGAQSAVLSGNSIQLISNGVAISTINGTSTAIIPTGTTTITTNSSQHNVSAYQYANINVIPATATITISLVTNSSQYSFGGFYNFANIKGYDYDANDITGSGNRAFYCAYGANVEKPFLLCTPSTGFRYRFIMYTCKSNFSRSGFLDFSSNTMRWTIDAQYANRAIAGTTGWLDADTTYTPSQGYYTGKVYIPVGGANEQYKVIVCGYYA